MSVQTMTLTEFQQKYKSFTAIKNRMLYELRRAVGVEFVELADGSVFVRNPLTCEELHYVPFVPAKAKASEPVFSQALRGLTGDAEAKASVTADTIDKLFRDIVAKNIHREYTETFEAKRLPTGKPVFTLLPPKPKEGRIELREVTDWVYLRSTDEDEVKKAVEQLALKFAGAYNAMLCVAQFNGHNVATDWQDVTVTLEPHERGDVKAVMRYTAWLGTCKFTVPEESR